MSRTAWLLFLLVNSARCLAQSDSVVAVQEIVKFQKELNEEYKSRKESPLEPAALRKFRHHDFFPIDLKYRVVAKLTVTEKEPFFKMKTSTLDEREHRKYGQLEFTIAGEPFTLNVYQSGALMKTAEYKNYLFLPFTDLTNDKQTYAGGRYMDLIIPEGNEVILDFNKAYNPYCAYSRRFSCPIVPSENHLKIEILAGIRLSKK